MSKFISLILILLIFEAILSNTLTIESHESEEVTFITENEGYDNYDEESTDSNKKLTFEEKCPPHPQHVTAENQNLCTKTRCNNDSDCNNATSIKTVCCFNGCVYSCLPQMQSPPLFDWTEETNLKPNSVKIKYESSSEENPSGTLTRRLNAKKAPGEIALPGGCIVTHDQYVDLLAFKRNNHVQSCSCLQKEVLCQVV